MKILIKNLVFAFLIFLTLVSIFAMVGGMTLDEKKEVALNQLARQINDEKVKSIVVKGNDLDITLADNAKEKSRKEFESSLTESLKNYGIEREKLQKVDIEVKGDSGTLFWIGTILPIA